MLDPSALETVEGAVDGVDFYHQAHRLIFGAIVDLASQGSPTDPLTVGARLAAKGHAEVSGGLPYLGVLAREASGSASAAAAAALVRETATLRAVLEAADSVSGMAYAPGGRSAVEVIDAAAAAFGELGVGARIQRGGPRLARDLLASAVDRLDERSRSGDGLIGLATGFDDLDRMTLGLRAGDLILVAGRPSMGKTAFAMNVVEHVTIRGGRTALVFSLEMDSSSLIARLIASIGRIDFQRLQSGRLLVDEWPKVTVACEALSRSLLFVDDSVGLTVSQIRLRARKLKRERGLDIVVVDYIGLMRGDSRRENRAQEVAEISRALKALARELEVPVVALSQLNRALESRQNKRPTLADLRDSGALEQDADMVLMLYREHVYSNRAEDRGKAEVIVAKARMGETGIVNLSFFGAQVRFEGLASW
jgi:replicative DNA helicase